MTDRRPRAPQSPGPPGPERSPWPTGPQQSPSAPGPQRPTWPPGPQQAPWPPGPQQAPWPQQPPPGWQPQPGGPYSSPPRRENSWPIFFIVVAILLALVLVIGCMAYVGSQFGTFFGGTALEELSVGQCFNGGRGEYGPAAAIISTVEVVACTEPHTSELIATLDYPGAGPAVEFPGIDSVQTFALQECIDSFADYVGIDYDESELEITYVYPLEHNWNAGDYSIQCIVHPPVGQDQTTQSYRRARR